MTLRRQRNACTSPNNMRGSSHEAPCYGLETHCLAVGQCHRIGLLLGAVSAFAQRETLTIFTINDVYEIAPVQGRGGLAELMTMLKTERATATTT